MEDLRQLRAKMNLAGLSRREAAKALYLSYSALNRKLRGELGLTDEERARLLLLTQRKEPMR
jgi:transposase